MTAAGRTAEAACALEHQGSSPRPAPAGPAAPALDACAHPEGDSGSQRVERFRASNCARVRRRGASAQARPGPRRAATPESRRAPVSIALCTSAMAAYKLVLIRHGESAWNLENRFSGWYDADLSPAGHEEAKRGGQALRGAERAGLWVRVRRPEPAPLGQGLLTCPRALSERAETLDFISPAFYFALEKMGLRWRGGRGGGRACSRSPRRV